MTTEDFAAALAAARQTRTKTAHPPAADFDEAEAYRIQSAASEAYGSPRIGYKIGATSPQAQKIIGCDAPFFGPMFEADRVTVGSKVAVDETIMGLECEFAFQMAAPFPVAGGGRSLRDLSDAVGRCAPAFELIGRRIAGDGFPTAIQCVADFGLNAGFCVGSDMDGWREADLAAISVTASIDGVETNSGTAKNVLGNPLAALLWLAEALEKQGRRLEPGEWVSTGTCLGVVAVRPGTSVTARYSHGAEMGLDFA